MQVRFILKGHTRNHTPLKSVAINPGITPTMVVAKNIMVITTMGDTKEAMEDIKVIMVDSRETITMVNTIIANAMEKSKLGKSSFDEHDIFSPPSMEEKIYFDDTMPPDRKSVV